MLLLVVRSLIILLFGAQTPQALRRCEELWEPVRGREWRRRMRAFGEGPTASEEVLEVKQQPTVERDQDERWSRPSQDLLFCDCNRT
jgi:hypothetical protein